jgi:hypothetical protein
MRRSIFVTPEPTLSRLPDGESSKRLTPHESAIDIHRIRKPYASYIVVGPLQRQITRLFRRQLVNA